MHLYLRPPFFFKSFPDRVEMCELCLEVNLSGLAAVIVPHLPPFTCIQCGDVTSQHRQAL